MADPISNSDDIIDSRDVIARIEELQATIDEAMEAAGNNFDADPPTDTERADFIAEHLQVAHPEDYEEWKALTALAAEASDYAPDWEYGEALIRDSYFRNYAEELADDIGAINSEAIWPNNCIDWERAARELQMDYTSVDFAGVTYWIR